MEPIAPRFCCLVVVDLLGQVVLTRVAIGGHAAKIKVAVKIERAMPIRISRRVERPGRREGGRRKSMNGKSFSHHGRTSRMIARRGGGVKLVITEFSKINVA